MDGAAQAVRDEVTVTDTPFHSAGITELYLALMICYTGHINWNWVLEEALGRLPNHSANKVASRRQLPSSNVFASPNRYSLFRAEICTCIDGVESILAAWVTSQCLEFLDPKDALYEEVQRGGAAESMPITTLLEWNSTDESGDVELPSQPALLKAPLGSGGDSLYFVNDRADIYSVIGEHAAKAESVPGFLDGLRAQYGNIPRWSLQEVYPSIMVDSKSRKCQLRAYVVYCGSSLYLYTGYEVRLPKWTEQDSGECNSTPITAMLQADLGFSEGSAAVPYNFGRSKVHTERKILQEVPELITEVVESAITALMVETFTALQPAITAHRSDDMYTVDETSEGIPRVVLSEMAIAGVDLLINSELRPKIVELNNNPAMPAPHKHMTPLYRQHLVDFVRSIVLLGINPNITDTEMANLKFMKIF